MKMDHLKNTLLICLEYHKKNGNFERAKKIEEQLKEIKIKEQHEGEKESNKYFD